VASSLTRGTLGILTRTEPDSPPGGDAPAFWDALDDSAREDLITVAELRIFPAGAKLMQQGTRADHVAVISSGRVRVYVRQGGQDRELTVRGRGELVGERAALRVGERPATVQALDKVRALILTTEQFRAFASAHPVVLRIVENQIYNRGAAQPLRGQNCTIIVTDVAGFASHTRNDQDRLAIRRANAVMTMAALDPFWDMCFWADRGDGLTVVVPPDTTTKTVMERLLTVLPAELSRYNAACLATSQFQLRVAVNVGPVDADIIGLSGEAIIRAARILEAPVFRNALARTGSTLGVIASDFVFDTVIKHGGDHLDPAAYFQVQVKVKETRSPAWIQLVDQPADQPVAFGASS
jgi:CRP-like cAMP-binding protein